MIENTEETFLFEITKEEVAALRKSKPKSDTDTILNFK